MKLVRKLLTKPCSTDMLQEPRVALISHFPEISIISKVEDFQDLIIEVGVWIVKGSPLYIPVPAFSFGGGL